MVRFIPRYFIFLVLFLMIFLIIFFSLAYFIVRLQYIVRITYNICVNKWFMLSIKLLAKGRIKVPYLAVYHAHPRFWPKLAGKKLSF